MHPLKERVSLVILNLARIMNFQSVSSYLKREVRKIYRFAKSLKKLSKIISFKQPYYAFFERAKINVLGKLNHYLMRIIEGIVDSPEKDPFEMDIKKVVNAIRIEHLYLQTKLQILKIDYFSN